MNRLFTSAFFALAVALSVGPAGAHDVLPPKLQSEATAEWPGAPETHDVVVPVLVTVSPLGTVEAVVVEASISPAFDHAAIEAAQSWSFQPATRDGRPISAKIRATVRFVGRAAGTPAPAAPPETAAPAAAAAVAPPEPAPASSEKVQNVVVRGASPPRSASEITRGRDVLTAAPHKTASDLLKVVPGVSITQHSGDGKAHQIFLRGFDAVHGQDLELWVGGIPVNEVSNIHGQGYADLHFVMPEVIKEVQSTPGTYDPRQGDFAVAGTVRMKLGLAEPGITAKGTIGSFGTRRLFLAYHPKDASDETFAAFEEYSTDGFGPSRAARRGSFVGQATHDFGDGVAARIYATTSSSRFDSPGVLRLSDIERGVVDRFATYDSRQGGHSSRTQLLVELHKDDEGARWTLAPFVGFRSLALRHDFTGFLVDKENGDNTQQLHDATTAGATASYRKTLKVFSIRDVFEAGFFARGDFIEQSQQRLSFVDDSPTASLVDAKVRATDVAGYLDGSIFPVPRLALRGGLRVDALSYSTQDRALEEAASGQRYQRSAHGAHLGKKLTADFGVTPKLHALASYGEGFRSPQARSLNDGEKTPFTTVRSYEAGVRYAEGTRFSGSLAAFHTDLSQDLVFDHETARNESVPATQRNGLALELLARARDWLTVSGSATYTRASFTEGDARYAAGDLLPYVPQLVVRTDTALRTRLTSLWNRPLEGRVGYGIEALASRPLPFAETGRNTFLVDVSAGLRLKEVELGLDVYNLLDSAHYDGQFVYASSFNRGGPAQLVPARHVTVGPPRSIFMSLTLHI